MPTIVYAREARVVVEGLFATIKGFEDIWAEIDKNASLADMEARFLPHAATIKDILSRPVPKLLS
jgi:hypothetical protein